MLIHPTLDQLRALKLDGMAQAFLELEAQEESRNLAHPEWLALLLDREAASRNTKRFQSRLRVARLRSQPSRHRGRRLPNPTSARQGTVPAARNQPLDRRAPQPARHRPMRRGQVLAVL